MACCDEWGEGATLEGVVCLSRDVVDGERDSPRLYHFRLLASFGGSDGVGKPPKPYWHCNAPKAAA